MWISIYAINKLSKEEVDWNSYWFIMRAQTFKWLFLKTLKSADSPFWRSAVGIYYLTLFLWLNRKEAESLLYT